ncbi:DUF2336 domain-containing protein [Rhodoplanes sp. Z2-YC6860]|uniref:DUF2336 domain-containing protein n=1 Tax=Rhodoplanes sp. Z2-YC6860 TaxID=674703 RepID=UPI00078BBC07|nr:DUF2336 domain-containing protein [Rhodoplanes sp. Z2-YC6860]AMN41320.1 hypothetical protein RHPLAN_28830 [Rhodoplanes sp. Z2-YC6860]
MSETAEEISGALTQVLCNRSAGERGRVVRQVADLFLTQHGSYSGEQVDLFDSVIMKMVGQVDEAVRVYLSERLAPIGNAPREVIMTLAGDAAIAVAGPVLTQSLALEEEFLLDSARMRSQQHLIAISSRKMIGSRVTDVLIDRGDDQVVMALAQNGGAVLSERGYTAMVERAHDNRRLASAVWSRPDIPRPHLVALFEKASEAVRRQLEAEGGAKAEEVAAAIGLARRRLKEASQERSTAYAEARKQIATLKETGGLSEAHILSFARQGQFEAVVTAVSEFGQIPAIDTERMILDPNCDRLFVVAKAIGLSWICVRQIVLLNEAAPRAGEHTGRLRAKYQAIPHEVAAKGLRFHQLRERARHGAMR